MSLFTKSFGFLAVLTTVQASYALTARPSVIGTASSRMPTMTSYITGLGTSTSGTTTTTSNLLANAECIDAYTNCMKGGDACGSDFEECTTKVLFHGKMPQCLSTLAQCSTTGVASLFGTGTVTALSTVASKNSYGEVTDYTYPTDGSVLGQLIIGAAISNKYDTSTCVKRYTACLRKDSVCGNDFELCTTDKEFRKQRVFCDSTLARCQSEGLIELFGSANTSVTPSATSRVGEMIAEGAALAAVNAVSTCYKVVDQCFLNACAENPYKCYENSTTKTVKLVDFINTGINTAEGVAALSTVGADIVSKSNIAAYLKNSCMDTIGSNKYCYATFLGNGQMPTSSQLKDEDNQEEIYDEAYSARMNAGMKAKIADLVDKFDTKAKEKCTDTIKTCVMRICGSGSGAACYSQVFGNKDQSINNHATYNELKTGCEAVVNTDAYCKYAAANPNKTGSYSYTYINNDAFTTLFPEYEEGGNDPIGVIAALNATLASSYSDAAIATMKRQCQAVATSCVKSMCGADYQNCYRNRTDVYSSLTSTGDSSFDKSMNKVGGVLDYTIVLGRCLDTVKNASVCEEHLAIERNKLKIANKSGASSWGSAGNVREGWIDAGSATAITANTEQVAAVDENGNALCTAKGGTDQGVCYSVDAAGNVYDQPVMISYTTYVESQAASTLFKDLVYDLEKEAQAKYKAKLTREQNICMAANSGGVKGKNDLGSTYQWVKLKSNTVPKGYAVSGLKANQFAASNDIYGSFCRIRVTLQSDDKRIQDVIAKGTDWSTAYFAVGDAFTCGSWIPGSALEKLADAVASDARDDAARGNKRTMGWATFAGVVGGGALGAWGGNSITDSNFLGGLMGGGTTKSSQEYAQQCVSAGDRWLANKNETAFLTRMLTNARKINTNKKIKGVNKEDLESAIRDLTAAMSNSNLMTQNGANYTNSYDCQVKVRSNGKGDLSAPNGLSLAHIKLEKCTTTTQNGDALENCEPIEDLNAATKGYVVYCSNGYVQAEVDSFFNGKDSSVYSRNTTETISRTLNAATANPDMQNVSQAVVTLQTRCRQWDDEGNSQKAKSIGALVGTGVGSIAGGILANRITNSVLDAKLDKVEKEAYDAWMEDVGNHINCMVGNELIGQYGDLLDTAITD